LFADSRANIRLQHAEAALRADMLAQTAADGHEAFASALVSVPDVVVSAVNLTGIDGFELCRCLRRSPTTRNTAVILVLGHVTPEVANAARVCGCDALVTEPCPFDAMERIIARVVRERRAQIAAFACDRV
jgi:CheY-like chemotaxis protein